MTTLRSMTKKQWIATACFAVFLAAEAAFYITFLVMDATHRGDSVPVKYVSVIFCMLFSFLYFGWPSREKLYVSAAMIFTVIADAFLLVWGKAFEAGVVFFIVVQIFYALRLINLLQSRWWITSIVRVVLCAATVGALGGIGMLTALNGLSAVYFVNLVVNTAEAWALAFTRDRRMLLFAIGLTLFCACDICVGLYNLGVADLLGRFVSVAMWAFYLPSQVLIVLSRFVVTDPRAAERMKRESSESENSETTQRGAAHEE